MELEKVENNQDFLKSFAYVVSCILAYVVTVANVNSLEKGTWINKIRHCDQDNSQVCQSGVEVNFKLWCCNVQQTVLQNVLKSFLLLSEADIVWFGQFADIMDSEQHRSKLH